MHCPSVQSRNPSSFVDGNFSPLVRQIMSCLRIPLFSVPRFGNLNRYQTSQNGLTTVVSITAESGGRAPSHRVWSYRCGFHHRTSTAPVDNQIDLRTVFNLGAGDACGIAGRLGRLGCLQIRSFILGCQRYSRDYWRAMLHASYHLLDMMWTVDLAPEYIMVWMQWDGCVRVLQLLLEVEAMFETLPRNPFTVK